MRFASIHCSKMRLRPGLRPGPCLGAYSASPDSIADFKWVASRRGGEGKGEKGKGEKKGKRGEGHGRRRKGGEGDSDAQLEQGRRDWLRPVLILCAFLYFKFIHFSILNAAITLVF